MCVGIAVPALAWTVLRTQRARHELAGRLREARAEAAELRRERMSFLTAFSHECRTPLTAVLGIAQTLAEHQARLDPPDAKALVERLVRNARTLAVLVDGYEVLGGAPRIDAAAEIDVPVVIRSVVGALDAPRHRIEVDADECSARVDRRGFELMLEHLLINVVKHTPPGTAATVRARRTPEGLDVEVSDDGPGVPEELMPRVFEPFRQHQAPIHAPGVGVGLAVVRRLAALHGGTVSASKRPGGGASFRIVLPQ